MSGWRVQVKAQVGALALDVDLAGDAAPLALVGPNGSGKSHPRIGTKCSD